jgi:hypothetical protein
LFLLFIVKTNRESLIQLLSLDFEEITLKCLKAIIL